MGLDFTALIHYDGPTAGALDAISGLERGDEDPTLSEVMACGLRNEFAFAKHGTERAFWRCQTNYDHRLKQRPDLPTLEACLELPSEFTLTFGRDAVWVYHPLRWMFFVREAEWQEVMLAATRRFCTLLGSRDCVVTNDENPAILAFQEGASFQDSLSAAVRLAEGEVAELEDLYTDKGQSEELVFIGPNGESSAIPVWDTHGYWRLRS